MRAGTTRITRAQNDPKDRGKEGEKQMRAGTIRLTKAQNDPKEMDKEGVNEHQIKGREEAEVGRQPIRAGLPFERAATAVKGSRDKQQI
mgnify:CR=1 FL=1